VSLAIAAIPEEFSMIYTLYLALGAWRLAQEHALVRRLPSVETLGSTTVICTDKTGTLTHGRVAVGGLWTTDGARSDGGSLTAVETELLETAVLACEPDPYDPLDVAIVDHARRHGIDTAELHAGKLARDWPFDPVAKYLTHVWQGPGDAAHMHAAAKGALEGILDRTRADPRLRAAAAAANLAYTSTGMRVVAVAAGTAPPTAVHRTEDEAHLRLVGLVAFHDPPRDGVADALAECRAAGIRVVMITGDHPATAHAVAEGLGLPHETAGTDVIATGDDLDRAQPGELDALVATTNVFARTRPEQKHRIVTALRRLGAVVAMTGDGINDAPALREADIGVAMGSRGTEVARESAALVLLDDNFATIVGAIRDGRRIFDNLTRAFAYLIAFHPPLLLGALILPLIGKPLLFLPVHLVVLELLLHPVVSLVFQADPADADAMRRPPRPVADALRIRAWARPYAVGSVLALVLVGVYLAALSAWPEEQARALAFASLLASQPVLLLSMRSPHHPLWTRGSPWTRTLTVVVAIIAAATFSVVYLPPLADLLHLEPFPPAWWAAVFAVAASTAWSDPFKGRRPHSPPRREEERHPKRRRRRWPWIAAAVVGLTAVSLSTIPQVRSYISHLGGSPTRAWPLEAFPPADRPRLRLAAVGDIGHPGGREDATAAAIASAARSREYDALVLLGDNVYPRGDPAQLDETVFGPFGQVLDGGAQLWPILGNHDVMDGHAAANVEALHMPGRWYAKRLGDLLFVALDSNDLSRSQLDWFDRTLSESDARWTIVALHHPPYSSGYQGSDLDARRLVSPIAERHGVELVLSGHEHDYERSRPIDGVTYVVSGAGSETRRTGREEYTAAAWSWHHFVDISVYDDRLVVRAVNQDVRAFDEVVIPAAAREAAHGP
jgi:phosphoserine phosphatase